MVKPGNDTVELAKKLREKLAGGSLPPSFAKLYSHHTRLRAGQPSLAGWRTEEAPSRLRDAIELLKAAFIERDAGSESWRVGLRRAAELLEWLSHRELNLEGLPIRLLAAAAYQLAGYPARSAGLLKEEATENTESDILRSLLKADFPVLFQLLARYWQGTTSPPEAAQTFLPWHDIDALCDKVQEWVVNETASCLGVLCAAMRWGNESRLEKALDKLLAIGKILLFGDNPYSWLLARLCAEVARAYVDTSLRSHLDEFFNQMTPDGKIALERYLQQSYRTCRSLAWPSQIRGIKRLNSGESFALCTPTGSGKTTVAELAILQSLFSGVNCSSQTVLIYAPLAIYLVPSRALAAEVESKLSRVLRHLSDERVVVTGLYGGTDWGPTDAWLTAEDRTVLICTYEKAEALMRFLGPLFIHRVSLVVIDEAHSIQFDGDEGYLRSAESRSLRLESLGTRLLTHLDQNRSRVIALSAVASGAENALASWVAGQAGAVPAKTAYRSTRQLIGRLECLPNRRFEIRYDLLDDASLQFKEDGQADTPYIPNPFPLLPTMAKWKKAGPEKRLRPYLFWAAMHLAAPDAEGRQRAVLVSIAQHIEGYAEDFLKLLESTWANVEKPAFFKLPADPEKLRVWERCLRSCEDYFRKESREYRLLQKGIVVHHGKMPGLMARLFVEVIQERIVRLVLATSTLSEGVNLPFETILIPSLKRWSGYLNAREFGNLVGRAGRPGFSTEGRSLVLLNAKTTDWSDKQARKAYFKLVRDLQNQVGAVNAITKARSALAELIKYLYNQWRYFSGSNKLDDFLAWLEITAPLTMPLEVKDDFANGASLSAIEALDSLDGFLLSAIVEIEQMAGKELSINDLEERLKQIWQRSYAFYASQKEAKLGKLFIQRGLALKTKIYPDSSQRRHLYRTSLPPRSGNRLISLYPEIRKHLETGVDYARWNPEKRFCYIQGAVDKLSAIPKFRLSKAQGNVAWHEILRWWLDLDQATKKPTKKQISSWHNYVSKNFGYRFNWGLGSIVALAIDEAHGGNLQATTLEDWPQTGLPWIVFWLKELIVWGTLEPVAAYLLARGIEFTRADAEKNAQFYYNEQGQNKTPDELLDATFIRDWAQTRSNYSKKPSKQGPSGKIEVKLLRDFSNCLNQEWRVVPVEVGDELYWFDPAGFPMAICLKPEDWKSDYLNTHDFILDTPKQIVFSSIYI
jgi:hypothetical protein